MNIARLDHDARNQAVEILSRRLTPADLRSVLKELDRGAKGRKGVERIVAETENPGRLLRTRIDDTQLADFLVDLAGSDMLSISRLRYLLALRASEAELDQLHEFPGAARARGSTQESLARCVASRKWHPGKRWARHFVQVLGLPQAFAGPAGSRKEPDVEDVEPHVPLPPLEDFQDDLRRQVLEVLTAQPGDNRAVLTLPTGAGKTRTTVEALTDWWLSDREAQFILWIAQSDELCEQAVQAFKEVWIDRGDRDDQRVRDTLRIYRFWGNRRTVPDEDGAGIIISTIDKLREGLPGSGSGQARNSLSTLAETIGVVVIDEAHRAEAPSYRKVLEAVGIDFTSAGRSPISVLGLTATPIRSQKEETERLARRFYKRLLRPMSLPEDPDLALEALRERGILSRPVHRVLGPSARAVRLSKEHEQYLEDWKELHPELLLQLGQERDRNRQIIEAISDLDAAWPVLFFGCSVQHAEAIAVLLRRSGREAAAVTAQTREATRRQLVEAFRRGEIQVLCNYGVLTTGFDAPRVRAVVVGRPTTSRVLYDQMIGRGMRGPRFGGTKECLILDVDYNLIHADGRPLALASDQYAEYWT